MNYFYVTTNIRKSEPEILRSMDYIHVKGRVDGDATIVITESPVDDDNCAELSQEEAQELLDSWLEAENDGVEDEALLQHPINLSAFV